MLSGTICRSCGRLCRDPSHGARSLGDCLSVHSATPSGFNVGIPAMALDPWARACACTLSLLQYFMSGSQLRRWISGCVLAGTLCQSCWSLFWDPSNGTGSLGVCWRVHSVAPAEAYAGIPVTVLNPWVRACAYTLSPPWGFSRNASNGTGSLDAPLNAPSFAPW